MFSILGSVLLRTFSSFLDSPPSSIPPVGLNFGHLSFLQRLFSLEGNTGLQLQSNKHRVVNLSILGIKPSLPSGASFNKTQLSSFTAITFYFTSLSILIPKVFLPRVWEGAGPYEQVSSPWRRPHPPTHCNNIQKGLLLWDSLLDLALLAGVLPS